MLVMLMMLVMVLLWLLLGRAFPTRTAGGGSFRSRSTRRVRRVTVAKTREADWACLHAVARDIDLVGDNERLGHLIRPVVRRY
jgi:hypothetical protein